MSKSTITRFFVGSIVAVVAGIILGLAGVWFAYATDIFVMDGPDVVGVQSTAAAWSLVVVIGVAVLAVVGGLIAGLVAWIGALLNTANLEDKTWFVLLLVLGVFSFGLVAMIAYVIAGPDGSARTVTPQAPPAV
jgi:hypothetical protein